MTKKTLIEIELSKEETEKLIGACDYELQAKPKTKDFHIENIHPIVDARIKGQFMFDFQRAKPWYRLGTIIYGPIDLTMVVNEFTLIIDWHSLGIPRKGCVTIFKACGEKIEICWPWDFGTTELKLIKRKIRFFPTIASEVPISNVAYRASKKKPDKYELWGNVRFAALLINLVTEALYRGMLKDLKDLVKNMLKKVLGNSDVAKLFIKIIIETFNIVDSAVDGLGNIVQLIISEITDELLPDVFKDKIAIKLGLELDKKIIIMKKEGRHSEVRLDTNDIPPETDIGPEGLTVKLFN